MSAPEPTAGNRILARARADLGTEDYPVAIRAGHHDLVADEPPALGGRDAGPAPYEYLLSGLGACTAITLRMYAKRKQWDLRLVHVDLRFVQSGKDSRIERSITVEGDLSDDQRARLADIAERTPVTLTLKAGVTIETELRGTGT